MIATRHARRVVLAGLLLMLAAPAMACGGQKTATTTASTSTSTSFSASPADISASNAAVSDMSNAIRSNNVSAFTSLLSSRALDSVSGSPNLGSAQATALAEALRNAKIVGAMPGRFIYETNCNGVVITFLVIEEGGTWKIAEQ